MTVSSPRGPIAVEALDLTATPREGVALHEVLPGEVPEVATHRVSIPGGGRHDEPGSLEHEVVWFVLAGRGTFASRDGAHALEAETIARAPLGWTVELAAAPDGPLHALRVRRQIGAEDREELARFPQHNAGCLVRRFRDCPAYGESIKSARTTSRTLLPENHVPRMAAGTVEAAGPDEVAAHRHPMLEQLFLGLAGNDVTVSADQLETGLGAFALLHIPLGSNQGVRVAPGKRLHYVWIDFFGSREGQDWLKTHRPLEPEPPR